METIRINPVEMIGGSIGFYVMYGEIFASLTYDEAEAKARFEAMVEAEEIAVEVVPDWMEIDEATRLEILYKSIKDAEVEPSPGPCRHEAWVEGLTSCPSC